MKILFINPNVTDAITETMAAAARRAARPATELVFAKARFGTLYVENRIEAAIAGHAVLEILAENHAGCDAAIVAAFGDPGVYAAKEMMDIPVVGVSGGRVPARLDPREALFHRLPDPAASHLVHGVRGRARAGRPHGQRQGPDPACA